MEPRRHTKDELEAMIREAFAGVTREGGVSWSESVVVDGSGYDDERRKARESDKDATWEDLIEDERTDFDRGTGGWAFLDPIGYRYYLPAAMIRSIREGGGDFLCASLKLGRWMREYRLSQWKLLDDQQRRCVALYLDRMGPIFEETNWRELDSYWFQFLDQNDFALSEHMKRHHEKASN